MNFTYILSSEQIAIKKNKKDGKGHRPACSYKEVALFQSAFHLVKLNFVLQKKRYIQEILREHALHRINYRLLEQDFLGVRLIK
jgi:predicted transcriptional regulator